LNLAEIEDVSTIILKAVVNLKNVIMWRVRDGEGPGRPSAA